jgi:hypothetical protein
MLGEAKAAGPIHPNDIIVPIVKTAALICIFDNGPLQK